MVFSGILAGLCALAFAGTPAPAPHTVVMGFNPAENADTTELNGKRFAAYYQEKTGYPVKTFIATDYTALIEALRSGQIDFAWLPPFSFVKAEQVAGARVLLKAVRHGRAVYYSAIITRSDNPYRRIEDLKGKNVAWVDPSSTSGHIFPKAALIVHKKIDPDSFFARQVFAGSHDALVLAVLNGTVDAGATYCNTPDGGDGAWDLYLKTPEERKKIRVLFVSDPIPGDTLATSARFIAQYPDIVEKTDRLLLAMGNEPAGKKILDSLYHIDSMAPAKSSDYDPVRAAASALHIER
jgi:phosphonate transport system substrate-binding protein